MIASKVCSFYVAQDVATRWNGGGGVLDKGRDRGCGESLHNLYSVLQKI